MIFFINGTQQGGRREAASGHGLKDQFFDLNQQEFIGPYLLIGRDRTPVSVYEGDHAMTTEEVAVLGVLIAVVVVIVWLGFSKQEF